MRSTLMNVPCTLIRRSSTDDTDRYGDPIAADDSRVETVCEFQQSSSTDLVGGDAGSEPVTIAGVAFFSASTALAAGDAVEIAGTRYEVVGEPAHQRNPRTKRVSHIEVPLKRSRGSKDRP